MLVIGFAFVAGILTILAPCTLPLVPLVLGGSVGAGPRRLIGIIAGFGATFVAITELFASVLAAAGVTTSVLRTAAAIVFGIAGLALTWNRLGTWIGARLERLQFRPFRATQAPQGLAGGLVAGAGLGLLWAPCVGPIMAAAIAAAVVRGPTALGLATSIAYVSGAAIPLLVVARLGRRVTSRVGASAAGARRAFGVAMTLVSVLMLAGLDAPLQTQLSASLPGLSSAVIAFEEGPAMNEGLAPAGPTRRPSTGSVSLENLGPAPELRGITAWINSPPLTLAELRGKVVLVHFWTFGCVNCQNVQPYVKAWYERYADAGFVVIGVHTPELSFERDFANVTAAVAAKDVRFPVAFDPGFHTWDAYGNQYWPAFYFVDKDGRIRHVHFGEGDYDVSEAVIQELLAEP